MAFYNILKELRHNKGITQAEMSKMTGLGQSTIAMYESHQREPNFDVLTQLADFFNVSTDYLLDKTNVPTETVLKSAPASTKQAEHTLNLRSHRKELGLNLDDVAEIVGVSNATVSRWESGEISNMRRDRIELLAKALKVPAAQIIGITEMSPAKTKSTDLLDFLYHDDPDFLAKIRSIDIKGKINEPGMILKLNERQKDRIKDIIRLTVKEAEMNTETHSAKVTIKKG